MKKRKESERLSRVDEIKKTRNRYEEKEEGKEETKREEEERNRKSRGRGREGT